MPMGDIKDLKTRNRRLIAVNARNETLEDSRRLAAIVRQSHDAILLLDLDGRIVEWNEGAERMYGYSEPDALTMNVRSLVPESGRAEIESLLEQARSGHLPESSFEARRITRDGRTVDVWVSAVGLHDADGRLVAIAKTDRDITERKRARIELRKAHTRLERRMARRTQSLELLRDIAYSANEADDLGEVLEYALERVGRYNGWCAGRAFLAPGNGQGLLTAAAWAQDDAPVHRDFLRQLREVRRGSGLGLPDRVLADGLTCWSDTVGQDVSPLIEERADALHLKGSVAFPLLSHGTVSGVLEFFSERVVRLSPPQLDVLASVGTQVGIAIEREKLKRQIEDLTAQEQARLARDLHDAVGQQLAGLAMTTETITRRLSDAGSPESGPVGELAEGMRRALNDIRAMARGLAHIPEGPGVLARLVRQLCLEIEGRSKARIVVDVDTSLDISDAKTGTHLYRIAQEAVHNAVAHAGARWIRVALRRDGEAVVLSVEDDGRGFTDRPHAGIGLRTMRQRARMIAAELSVRSARGQGTSVICTAPLGGYDG